MINVISITPATLTFPGSFSGTSFMLGRPGSPGQYVNCTSMRYWTHDHQAGKWACTHFITMALMSRSTVAPLLTMKIFFFHNVDFCHCCIIMPEHLLVMPVTYISKYLWETCLFMLKNIIVLCVNICVLCVNICVFSFVQCHIYIKGINFKYLV